MNPTIDYRIPKNKIFVFYSKNEISFAFTSVLIDKRLFKSCIRYSGEGGGGGGNDGLNRKTKEFLSKKKSNIRFT